MFKLETLYLILSEGRLICRNMVCEMKTANRHTINYYVLWSYFCCFILFLHNNLLENCGTAKYICQAIKAVPLGYSLTTDTKVVNYSYKTAKYFTKKVNGK